MNHSTLLAELVAAGAAHHPERPAVTAGEATFTYGDLAAAVTRFAGEDFEVDLLEHFFGVTSWQDVRCIRPSRAQ